MDFCEIEFLAEDEEKVTVVPNFTEDVVHLITGDLGSFQAGLPVTVPLWIALHLKTMNRCRIMPPDWLNEEFLAGKLKEETDSPLLTPMPSHFYFEVAKLLLAHAEDDISNHGQIRTAVKDLFDARFSKLRSSIDLFLKSTSTHAKLNNITRLELRLFRPYLAGALDQLQRLRSDYKAAALLAPAIGGDLSATASLGSTVTQTQTQTGSLATGFSRR